MALQFIFGNSGSGKTRELHQRILARAKESPRQNFLVIVPEQFTMQTQRKLVEMHPGHSILNIDVLSFGRLAYRIFDELGSFTAQVLEETGKHLILRRVAQEKAKQLTVLKRNMTKMGYIGEVKSLISELTQYNVTPSQLTEAIEKLPEGSFSYKLRDVAVMYQGFLDFLEGRFVTAEETLELLSDAAGDSQILNGSVIAFDGFTGFTPIQNNLLQKLLGIAEDIYVTVTLDGRENPYQCSGMHELFAMSKKMIKSLQEMADSLHVTIEAPLRLTHAEHSRFHGSDALLFLEQNLFRSQGEVYALDDKNQDISVVSLKNPREEMHFIAREIARLVRFCGYHYWEIAVVCGDLAGYANDAPEIFAQYQIPIFVDQKATIAAHPFVEFVRAALEAVQHDFSLESIFRYLRSGFSQISRERTDLLENYCLAAGVRGYKKWSEQFCYLPKEYDETSLSEVNEIREEVASQFAELYAVLRKKTATVGEQTMALYHFLCARETERVLKQKKEAYEAAGDLKNAKEYDQIYRIVMDLLDKLVELLGDETIALAEYAKILDSGFEAAKVGIIPPGFDRVIFGDIERSRLDDIKVLFFAGVNDGLIPRGGGADGILSQTERSILEEFDISLAPTVRQKTFMQRFYLYLNMTKPSDRLYLTYARVSGDGKALKSSYLVAAVRKLFQNLDVQEIEDEPVKSSLLTPESARSLLARGLEPSSELRRRGSDEDMRYFAALCRWYETHDAYRGEMEQLFEAAAFHHKDTPISSAVTRALYGTELENSVTRLEAFAGCAFAHFLSYGLMLRERSESGFYAADIGTIFHEVLERYAKAIRENHYSWFTISEEQSEALLRQAMEQALGENHNLALYENARSRYAGERMYRILKRTVGALLYQVRQGKFTPEHFEVSFSYVKDLDAVNFKLSDDERMRLKGRIDRIDTYQKEDRLYVKVIDYKSGNTSFQFLNVYYGLQLQLVVYMNAALEMMQKRYPDSKALPAGIYYYHVSDPMVEADERLSEEEVRSRIFKELKLNGVTNDDREVLEGTDVLFQTSSGAASNVISAGMNKDGSLKKTSKTMSAHDFSALSAHANQTILRLGQRMMRGDISVSPYALADKSGCDYCEYRAVCQFDARIPGFSYRRLHEFSEEELMEKMREDCEGEHGLDKRTKAGDFLKEP